MLIECNVYVFVQARSQSLEMLNIGHNSLTNECLHVIKDSLQQNRTLLQLGMQSTHLTCEGAIALAECIADNPVIQVCEDNSVALRFIIDVKWTAHSPLLLDICFMIELYVIQKTHQEAVGTEASGLVVTCTGC